MRAREIRTQEKNFKAMCFTATWQAQRHYCNPVEWKAFGLLSSFLSVKKATLSLSGLATSVVRVCESLPIACSGMLSENIEFTLV